MLAHLEHVGVAAKQLGAGDADGEAREHHRTDDVDPALAHELEDDPGGGAAAGDDERLRVALHIATHQEIHAEWQGGTQDEAGQMLAHRGHARLPARLGWAAGVVALGSGLGSIGQGTAAVPEIRRLRFVVTFWPMRRIPAARGPLGRARPGRGLPGPRRYVRRHWRFVRGHVVTRGLLAGWPSWRPGASAMSARSTPEQLSRGPAARVRRRMWVAVEDAELAVAHAQAHDAPVAELPAVCRSLHSVAGELDGLLRHERRLPRGRGPTWCAGRWPS